jgi:hypothetical protein
LLFEDLPVFLGNPWKGGIMRNYELMFIVQPDLDETANETVEK